MDSGSFKSPNVFDDDDDLHVPSTPDKEKRNGDGICHIDARRRL